MSVLCRLLVRSIKRRRATRKSCLTKFKRVDVCLQHACSSLCSLLSFPLSLLAMPGNVSIYSVRLQRRGRLPRRGIGRTPRLAVWMRSSCYTSCSKLRVAFPPRHYLPAHDVLESASLAHRASTLKQITGSCQASATVQPIQRPRHATIATNGHTIKVTHP